MAELLHIRRILEQDPADAVLDLLLDSSHRAGQQWPRLPHGLRHREAESLAQALLHHHGGMPLQRIYDRGVLGHVCGRERDKVDPSAHRIRKLSPRLLDLRENDGALGIVRYPRDLGARQHQLGVPPGAALHPGAEAAHHADRVLERIPARDLHDQGRVPARGLAEADHVCAP